MRTELRLILCSLLFLTGMRDPFQPPEDSCSVGQLAQWRYQGMASGSADTGFLLDAQKRWHRVKKNERLSPGWRVSAMDKQELTVDVGDMCEPTRWTWQREGTKASENKDTAVADDTEPAAVSRRAQAGYPRGG